MIGGGDDYPAIERAAAARFGRLAREAGVERVIYLGGLGERGDLQAPQRPPRDGEGARRRGPAADLLPRRDGDRAGERVLRAAARRSSSGCRCCRRPTGCTRRRSRSAPRTSSTTCARRSTCPESAGREIEIGGPQVVSHLELVNEMARGARPQAAAPDRDVGRDRAAGDRRRRRRRRDLGRPRDRLADQPRADDADGRPRPERRGAVHVRPERLDAVLAEAIDAAAATA